MFRLIPICKSSGRSKSLMKANRTSSIPPALFDDYNLDYPLWPIKKHFISSAKHCMLSYKPGQSSTGNILKEWNLFYFLHWCHLCYVCTVFRAVLKSLISWLCFLWLRESINFQFCKKKNLFGFVTIVSSSL